MDNSEILAKVIEDIRDSIGDLEAITEELNAIGDGTWRGFPKNRITITDRSGMIEFLCGIEAKLSFLILLPNTTEEEAEKRVRAGVYLHGDMSYANKAITANFPDDVEIKDRFRSITKQLLVRAFGMTEEEIGFQ